MFWSTYIGFFRAQILPFSLYMTFTKHIYVFLKPIYGFQKLYFDEIKMQIRALGHVYEFLNMGFDPKVKPIYRFQNPYFDENKMYIRVRKSV